MQVSSGQGVKDKQTIQWGLLQRLGRKGGAVPPCGELGISEHCRVRLAGLTRAERVSSRDG